MECSISRGEASGGGVVTAQPFLIEDLPTFDVPLPQDELRLLASLPVYGPNQCVQEIGGQDEAVARRLEKRGLIKIHRWKDDPVAIDPTFYAGRLS